MVGTYTCPVDDQGKCRFCGRLQNEMVPSEGPPESLTVVGEAPGRQEVAIHRPFVGDSGKLLRDTLRVLGVKETQVRFCNAYLCLPPKRGTGHTPSLDELSRCRPRLTRELVECSPSKILMVGATALTTLIGSLKVLPITKWRGRGIVIKLLEKEIYGVPTYHPAYVLRDPEVFRDFANDIHKWLTHDKVFEARVEVQIPWTLKDALTCLHSLKDASTLSLDIETNSVDPLEGKIFSIGFGALKQDGSGFSVIFPESVINNLMMKAELYDFISGKSWDGKLCLHNAKFDLQFLQIFFNRSLSSSNFRDTMLLHYALDERPGGRGDDDSGRERTYRVHGLKDLARARYDAGNYSFNFEAFLKLSPGSEPYQRALQEMYQYQALDCYYTRMLHDDLLTEINDESPKLLNLHDQVFVPGVLTLKDTELHGVRVDVEYFKALSKRYEEELKMDLTKLQEIVGDPLFNPSSPKQVGEYLYGKLQIPISPQLGATTEKDHLQSILYKISPQKRESIQKILDYRQKIKFRSTYVEGILQRVDPDDRVRPDILMIGASTGRLSCQDPNLQNIPVLYGSTIRDGFISPEGYTLVEADYSQLELRVAAHYSMDPDLIRTFQEGRDIHRAVASKMFRKPEDQITDHERYLAKYVDFGVLYGRGAKSLVEGWEMDYLERVLGGRRWTLREAESFLQEFLNGFPRLKQWIHEMHTSALTNRYVETTLGSRRRFPLIIREGRSTVERQAVNTPTQGLAAQINFLSMIRLHNTFPEGAFALFPIHDAIMCEVRDDLVPEIFPFIHEAMEQHIPFESPVPFKAELKIGRRWGSLVKEEKYRVEDRRVEVASSP